MCHRQNSKLKLNLGSIEGLMFGYDSLLSCTKCQNTSLEQQQEVLLSPSIISCLAFKTLCTLTTVPCSEVHKSKIFKLQLKVYQTLTNQK